MTQCHHCQAESQANARFCHQCGQALASARPPAPLLESAGMHAAEAPWPAHGMMRGLALPGLSGPMPLERAKAELPGFAEHKAAWPPAPRQQETTPGTPPSLLRHVLIGAALAVPLVGAGAYWLAGRLHLTTPPATPVAHNKPIRTTAGPVEALHQPDLTHGRGVQTPPTLFVKKTATPAAPAGKAAPAPAPGKAKVASVPSLHKPPVAPAATHPADARPVMPAAIHPAEPAGKVDGLLHRGQACLQARQYDCAIGQASRAARLAPGNQAARQLLGEARKQRRKALASIRIE